MHLSVPTFHLDPGGCRCPWDVEGISRRAPRKAPALDGLEQSPEGPVFPDTAARSVSAGSPFSLCPALLSASALFFLSHAIPPHVPLSPLSLMSPGGPPPSLTASHPTLGHRLVHALRADTKAPGRCLRSLAGKLDL